MDDAAATAALEGRYAALRGCAAELSSEELLDVIALAQREKDAASARQAVALAHLSALEPQRQEDGTSTEVHRGLGHQRLDAPELAAPRLGVSVHVATRRMEDAIRQLTRTPAVVDAMASGDLDEQRARTVTEETEFLSPESAAEVVDRVKDVWGQLTVGPLRQLLARTAAQVDPDAVRAHVEDERARRGLTRRTGVHGTDHWRGDFRVEDARTAWAAVTERARQLVREKKADSLELARADAMMELILEHSDVKVVVHATRAADEATTSDTDAAAEGAATAEATTANTDDEGTTTDGATTTDTEDEGATTDEATISDTEAEGASTADEAGTAHSDGAATGSGEDLVEVGGLGTGGTTFVRRAWLENVDSCEPERDLRCDRGTGGLVHGDVPAGVARGQDRARRAHRARERARDRAMAEGGAARRGTDEQVVDFSESYRVPDGMARLIRLRDGTCRFPGCATPSRQCDLDHVRAWPIGATTPTNLMCLCRRHHRIKQRDGWTVRLLPDGTVTWTDPTGLQRTTWPVDHLHLVTAGQATRDLASASGGSFGQLVVIPSTLEEELIELLGGPDKARPRAHPTGFDFDGNTIGGPPPPVDLDRTLEAGTGAWDEILIEFPPRTGEPIPF